MIDDNPPEIKEPKKTEGKGTGSVEAPRGTLYHHYEIKDGLVDKCDIIAPTTQNLDHMELTMRKAAEVLLTKDEDIKPTLEMIVRAYDPCISCSAHLVEIKNL